MPWQGLIVPVLPFALTKIAHVPQDAIQKWTGILLGGYGAGVFIGAPIIGYLADQGSSRRFSYMFGLITLGVSTSVFAAGSSTTTLLVGRALQGVSTASVEVGTAILVDTVGEGRIGPIMGVVDMSMALGSALGPACGGFLYHRFGYNAVFNSAYVLIALDLALRLIMQERGRDTEARSGDEERYETSSQNGICSDESISDQFKGSSSEHFPFDRSHRNGYGTILSGECCTSSSSNIPESLVSDNDGTSISSLQSSETFLPEPHAPPRRHVMLELLCIPRMQAALLSNFMQSVILTGLESTLPLRVKNVFSYNSKEVGMIFLLLCIPSFAAPAFGYLSDQLGARVVVTIGFLGLAPSVMLLCAINHHSPNQLLLLCTLLLLAGIFLSMILTPVFSDIAYMVEERKSATRQGKRAEDGVYSQAFALMSVAYASGSLVGPLAGGLLAEKVTWTGLTIGAGTFCALCAVPSYWALGGNAKE